MHNLGGFPYSSVRVGPVTEYAQRRRGHNWFPVIPMGPSRSLRSPGRLGALGFWRAVKAAVGALNLGKDDRANHLAKPTTYLRTIGETRIGP